METFSALLALCAGNSPVTGEFPAQRPVMRSFDAFFDLRLNKRLCKQWLGWWFRRHRAHYDVTIMWFTNTLFFNQWKYIGRHTMQTSLYCSKYVTNCWNPPTWYMFAFCRVTWQFRFDTKYSQLGSITPKISLLTIFNYYRYTYSAACLITQPHSNSIIYINIHPRV